MLSDQNGVEVIRFLMHPLECGLNQGHVCSQV